MQKEVLGRCPICGDSFAVSKLSCKNCSTTIEGNFSLCKFCKLTLEQKSFIDTFIKCRGNIKEVEKELCISYPTVKNKLEDVANALGHQAENEAAANKNKKKDILKKLDIGDISVEEALKLIKE